MRAFRLFAFALLLGAAALAAPGNELSGGALPLLPEEDAPEREVSGGALPALPEPETPPLARDVGVDELPLLVNEPPEKAPERTLPDPVIGGQDSLLNPFAPLVVPQQPPAQAAPPEGNQPAPPTAAGETETMPAAPPAASEEAPGTPASAVRPAAPVPEAHLGRPSLPQALTDRMLVSTAPTIRAPTPLGSIPTQAEAFQDPFATSAAIRAPSSLPPLVSPPTFVGGAVLVSQPAASSPGLSPLSLSETMFGDDENATSSLSNRVSRALASLRVSFTAMSTGTGIFRVGDSGKPVLVPLGERLPGTDLTLTLLTAQSAQFSEDDVRHTLLLNP